MESNSNRRFQFVWSLGFRKGDCRQLPAWRSGRGPRTPRRTHPVSCPGAWPGCALCPSPLSSDEGPWHRDQGGPGGSPDTSNGTCGGENLESVSHHYCSRVRLSLFIFSNGSFSANLTGLLKEGWIWTHPEQSPDGLDKITDTRLGQNLTENSQSRLSDCYCCHRNSGWCR